MKAKKNALEWTVFAASVLIIGGVVALLVRGAMQSNEKQPDLKIETGAPVRSSDGYTVPVIVRNEGSGTAEQARIRMALVENGRDVETAELVITFVPRQSRREGWVVFRRDPACCTVAARTLAYEKP